MKLGILPLGRPTFDVPFAQENLAAMLSRLDNTEHEIAGSRDLLFDADATRAAITDLQSQNPDRIVILQVTFTDAAMTVEIANAFDAPLSIWAIPEPRIGGRLRLNSFCGLNLASHALGLSHVPFSWIYGAPETANLEQLWGDPDPAQLHTTPTTTTDAAKATVARLRGKTIARIGERPDGFHTCDYDKTALKALADINVAELTLDTLFDTAKDADTQEARHIAERDVEGLDAVNQEELTRSLKLKTALKTLQDDNKFDAFAIRCWPETFTEYGGAVCGPVSQMGEAHTPCACEADVYGALTQLILQDVADAPVFLADLVDMDTDDNTGVVWHCGPAPISMRDDTQATATIHTNRKMPLLYEFPLKPGRVTLMRISQAHGSPKMILSSGDMLQRPMAFTGTSGVIRFDRPAEDALTDIIASGLEHHMAIAYGDHNDALKAVAAELKLPVLDI